jgi:uncharacterized protein YacL
MLFHILRALFVLLMAAVGYFYLDLNFLTMAIALSLGVMFICIDILSPRRKLAIFAGSFFGVLIGSMLAYGLSFVVSIVVGQASLYFGFNFAEKWTHYINLMTGVVCCYLCVSFILQTKDDFRLIIPYVEFSKQIKGARPILLDTSALVDGRIADVVTTGIIESQLIVPRFILDELQLIADHGDTLKRNRGRRGLDVLARLRKEPHAEVQIYESAAAASQRGIPVDQRLMDLAKELHARVLSNDYNLSKVAQLRGVDVVNINDLANALKPIVLPGERLAVHVVEEGSESGQGKGYLADGTMVVIEHAREHMNEDVEFTVSRVITTAGGRIVFGRMTSGEAPAATPKHVTALPAQRPTPVR